ncbi:MBL fold metallo-hydrolase [Actinomyces qiguomingii]|uniref:MBL fold metallo-hydrolase n=1 Tax=Actinomyces qiguomingii TaxID=2057800 RepID=UPI000CA04827|nr:MBL fold metallo-hydrolase [Actinomyces qiguomingii]
MFPYYTAAPVTESVTAIRSVMDEILYLIRGEDRAILIDTCSGVGHLRDFVRNLTDKPLTVLLTHGHVDHAMGAPEFEDVHLNRLDRPVYDEMAPLAVRKEYIAMGVGDRINEITADDYVPPYPVSLLPLEDGDSFDAGGIHVDAFHFPGHTPGMTALLIREERILILSDGCNQRTFLFDHNSVSVEEYRENVLALKKRTAGHYDRLFVSHGTMEVPLSILDEAVELCDVVLSGRADDVPFEFMGQTAYVAKSFDEATGMRRDGRFFNMVYNKDRVHRRPNA